MQPSNDVVTRHLQVEKLLSHKMKPLIEHNGDALGPLSLSDIYNATTNTLVVCAPPDLQLEWYFANFGKVQQLANPPKDKHGKGYTTRAGLADKKLAKAIWYYGIDRCHSFTRRHREVRYNVFLTLLVVAHPDQSSLCSSEALDFAFEFILAWLESLENTHTSRDFTLQNKFLDTWLNGKYDLVWLERNERKKLSARMLELCKFRPECSFSLEDFIRDGHLLPREQWNSAGAALAYQKIWQLQKEAEDRQKEQQAEVALNESEDLGLGRLVMNEHAFDLNQVNWNAPLVRAVLAEETNPVVMDQSGQQAQEWLPTDKIWDIIQMSPENLADLLTTLAF